jgi:hypothetical protein
LCPVYVSIWTVSMLMPVQAPLGMDCRVLWMPMNAGGFSRKFTASLTFWFSIAAVTTSPTFQDRCWGTGRLAMGDASVKRRRGRRAGPGKGKAPGRVLRGRARP